MQEDIQKNSLNIDDTAHQRQVLAEAIAKMAVNTGLYSENSNINGAHLLMACDDVTKEMLSLQKQNEELKLLTQKLLNGADSCTKEPHYIIQPFLNIVKQHVDIISQYDLDAPLKKK